MWKGPVRLRKRLNANEVTDTNANRLEYAVAMKLITEE